MLRGNMTPSIVCVHKLLTDSLFWLIRGLQLSGYLPFGITNGRLQFAKFRPPLLLWSSVLALLTVGLIYVFLVVAKTFVGERVSKEVEMLSIRTLTVIMGVTSLVFKAFPCIYRRRMEDFWIQNCKVLEFTCCTNIDGFMEIRSLQQMLAKSKKGSKRDLLILTVFGIVLLLVQYTTQGRFNDAANAVDRGCYWSIVRILAVYSFWIFISFIDGCLCFLIAYFLRLYTSLFGIIAGELQTLSLQTGMNDMCTMVAPIVIDTRSRHMATRKLVRVVECLYRVENVVQEVNSLFGPMIFIEIGLAVCFVLGHTFFCICSLLLGNLGNAISDFIWVSLFASRIFLLGTVSSNLNSKSQQIAKELMIIARGKLYFGAEIVREVAPCTFEIPAWERHIVYEFFYLRQKCWHLE